MSGAEKDGGADRPTRIQLSRAKGWKMPPNTVKVDRSTIWGNPYRAGERLYRDAEPATADDVVEYFRAWIHGVAFEHGQTVREYLAPLRGKNLACWCKPGQPCHADVLLEVANG